MNADLFKRVNNRILAEHGKVNMEWVIRKVTKSFKKQYSELGLYDNLDCGAVGCYCGHTILEANPSLYKQHFSSFEVAAKLLDIPSDEAEYLFVFHANISGPYRDLRYELEETKPGTLAYAKIVVKAAKLCMQRNKGKHYEGRLKDNPTVADLAA